MRIISGKLKGRTILVPKNFKGRPTTDFAREGLFNILGHMTDWDGANVLDLFAGTGAFGIECFSRGAEKITAIDIQPLHVKFIYDNFRLFEMNQANAIKQDVFKFLSNSSSPTFDIVFADPPFDLVELLEIPDRIFECGIMKSGGFLVVEHGKRTDFTKHPKFQKMRSFSNVCFSFFSDSE